jgi:hypothetical protein
VLACIVGTAQLPHLLLMSYPEISSVGVTSKYVPRIFGYRRAPILLE